MHSRVVALACLVMLGVSACSGSAPEQSADGQPQLGSAADPTTTTTTTATTTAGNEPGGGAPGGGLPPAGAGTTQPRPATSASGGATTPSQVVDFGFGWSNAECQWSITGNGSADLRMTGNVAATSPNTAMITLTVTSNGGGVPQTVQYYPAAHLNQGDNRYVAEIVAPLPNLANHTIAFTGTLTFNGQRDDLATDDANSLAVTFPATFQAAPGDNVEYLGCRHV
jgi:hypothetical protein